VVFSQQAIPVRKATSLVVFVAALAAFGLFYAHHKRSETKKAVAVFSDYGTSTTEREVALQVLSKDSSPETTKAIIAIALSPNVRPDGPRMLIRVLAARPAPETSEALSEFLQPHIAPAIRREAADALRQTGCTSACILNILHYKERLWKGEVPSELDVEQHEDAKTQFESEENTINEALDYVLQRSPQETLQQLRTVYGLGSMHPSPFALYLLRELTFAEGCADLSKPYPRQIASEEKRKAIDAAMQRNKCETKH
jgi:hypothetical protein